VRALLKIGRWVIFGLIWSTVALAANEPNPFEMLGLKQSATKDEILSQFHKLVYKHHSDKDPTSQADIGKLVAAKRAALKIASDARSVVQADKSAKGYAEVIDQGDESINASNARNNVDLRFNLASWMPPHPWSQRHAGLYHRSIQVYETHEVDIYNISPTYLSNLKMLYAAALDQKTELNIVERALVVFDFTIFSEGAPAPGSELAFINSAYRRLLARDLRLNNQWTIAELFLAGFYVRSSGEIINDLKMTYKHPFFWRTNSDYSKYNHVVPDKIVRAFAHPRVVSVDVDKEAYWVHFRAAFGLDNELTVLPFAQSPKLSGFLRTAAQRGAILPAFVKDDWLQIRLVENIVYLKQRLGWRGSWLSKIHDCSAALVKLMKRPNHQKLMLPPE
jgi:hypothetical protein